MKLLFLLLFFTQPKNDKSEIIKFYNGNYYSISFYYAYMNDRKPCPAMIKIYKVEPIVISFRKWHKRKPTKYFRVKFVGKTYGEYVPGPDCRYVDQYIMKYVK